MKTTIFCGKGGVGKTLCAVSLATSLSGKVGIIDYDGGHSVKNTLGLTDNIPVNSIYPIGSNMHAVIIESPVYKNITEAKELDWNLTKYLNQFPNNLGIIPYADMLHEFFGVPTDIPTLQKFAVLVQILSKMNNEGFDHVIIDVEPTAGLERLLLNANSTVRSLRNLKNKGTIFLTMLGAKWPDIARYLKGNYIRDIDMYTADIEAAVQTIKYARYLLVCTPERGPVGQTFEVRSIIEKFGGKIYGYVINNMRGEPHEEDNIIVIKNQNLPIVYINRDNQIHERLDFVSQILLSNGKQINSIFKKELR